MPAMSLMKNEMLAEPEISPPKRLTAKKKRFQDSFTTNEIELMVAAWQHFAVPPKIDESSLSAALNLAPRTISNRLWLLKSKMKEITNGNNNTGSGSAGTPQTTKSHSAGRGGSKRKLADSFDSGDEIDGDEHEGYLDTPTKKKSRGRPGRPVKVEGVEAGGGGRVKKEGRGGWGNAKKEEQGEGEEGDEMKEAIGGGVRVKMGAGDIYA